MKKVIKKEYIPGSKAFKLTYEDGSVGFGSDPGEGFSSMGDQASALKAIRDQLANSEELQMMKMLKGMKPTVYDQGGPMMTSEEESYMKSIIPGADSMSEEELKKKYIEILQGFKGS